MTQYLIKCAPDLQGNTYHSGSSDFMNKKEDISGNLLKIHWDLELKTMLSCSLSKCFYAPMI
ncbi:hypothetical protein COCNU_contig69200135G000010 [Cocos nucifera]|nr:hypothetical protein [Cocos nucifera]